MAGSDAQVALAEWLGGGDADQTAGAGLNWEDMASAIVAASQEASAARIEAAEAEARGQDIAREVVSAEARIAALRAEALEVEERADMAKIGTGSSKIVYENDKV